MHNVGGLRQPKITNNFDDCFEPVLFDKTEIGNKTEGHKKLDTPYTGQGVTSRFPQPIGTYASEGKVTATDVSGIDLDVTVDINIELTSVGNAVLPSRESLAAIIKEVGDKASVTVRQRITALVE